MNTPATLNATIRNILNKTHPSPATIRNKMNTTGTSTATNRNKMNTFTRNPVRTGQHFRTKKNQHPTHE